TTGQTEEMRKRIAKYLGDGQKGRTDSFIAFVKVGLELLKPGGYGLYVLPHSFLMSKSAGLIREELSKTCWIKCVADLSAIPVFENTGIYVILLIFQKKSDSFSLPPQSIVVKSRDFVGKALQDVLRKNFRENDFYSVYETNQEVFKNKEWHILSHSENQIEAKLKRFKSLSSFLDVRQGFVTGADDIFIVDQGFIPKSERELYVPYLPDKKMNRYTVPSKTEKYLFFPFVKNEKIELEELKERYPVTYSYLISNKEKLTSKKS